jgi:hypothetical protein
MLAVGAHGMAWGQVRKVEREEVGWEVCTGVRCGGGGFYRNQ